MRKICRCLYEAQSHDLYNKRVKYWLGEVSKVEIENKPDQDLARLAVQEFVSWQDRLRTTLERIGIGADDASEIADSIAEGIEESVPEERPENDVRDEMEAVANDIVSEEAENIRTEMNDEMQKIRDEMESELEDLRS